MTSNFYHDHDGRDHDDDDNDDQDVDDGVNDNHDVGDGGDEDSGDKDFANISLASGSESPLQQIPAIANFKNTQQLELVLLFF